MKGIYCDDVNENWICLMNVVFFCDNTFFSNTESDITKLTYFLMKYLISELFMNHE